MPQINRIRVNNIKYNFGTQFYDDFIMRFSGKNTIYDLANGGGKSVLMLLLLQNMIPNCTLDDKQPIEKLFRTEEGSNTIHSLVEWNLSDVHIKNNYKYMLTGFCARKAKDEERTDTDSAAIDYFNYVVFYREYNDNDIKNLPLSVPGTKNPKIKERITYNGLKNYLRELEKKDLRLEVRIFEKKRDYQRFIAGYGIYESEWEIIRGINKTEGHVRTYFESSYKTTKKVVEDLLIEEIIEKSFKNYAVGSESVRKHENKMVETLIEIKDKLLELSAKKEDIHNYDRQMELLREFIEYISEIKKFYFGQESMERELVTGYYSLQRQMEHDEKKKSALAEEQESLERGKLEEIRACEIAGIQEKEGRIDSLEEQKRELQRKKEELEEKQREALQSLIMAEGINDYLDYLYYKKERDIVRENIEKASMDKKELLYELRCLAAEKKRRDEKFLQEIEEKKREAETKTKKDKQKAETLREEKEKVAKEIAVTEYKMSEYEKMTDSYNEKITDLKRSVNLLMVYDLDKELNLNHKKIAETEALAEKNKEKISENMKDRQETEALLESLNENITKLETELEKNKSSKESFFEYKKRLEKLKTVYNQKDTDSLHSFLKEKLEDLQQQKEAVEAEQEEESAYLKRLKEGCPIGNTKEMNRVLDYINRFHGDVAAAGSDILKQCSPKERKELLEKAPVLPYSVVVKDKFEAVMGDAGLEDLNLGNYSVPVIYEAALRNESYLFSPDITLAMYKKEMFFDESVIAKEKRKTENELAELKNSILRLEDYINNCSKDLSYVEQYIGQYQIQMEEQEEKSRLLEIEIYQGKELLSQKSEEKKKRKKSADLLLKEQKEFEKNLDILYEREQVIGEIIRLSAAVSKYEEEVRDSYQTKQAAVKELSNVEGRLEAWQTKLLADQKLLANLKAREDEVKAVKEKYRRYCLEEQEPLEQYEAYTDNEIEVKFTGAAQAFESGNTDIADKQKLLDNYETAMEKCLQALDYKGLSVSEVSKEYESNPAYKSTYKNISSSNYESSCNGVSREELFELKRKSEEAFVQIKKLQLVIAGLQSEKDKIEGAVLSGKEAILQKYGVYEKIVLKCSYEEFVKYKQQAIADMEGKIADTKINIRNLENGKKRYDILLYDMNRVLTEKILNKYERKYFDSGEDICERAKQAVKKFERFKNDIMDRKEDFEKKKNRLVNNLQQMKFQPLADEISFHALMPANLKETDTLITGLKEIISCLNLEKDRIFRGIQDMEKIKQNFESQCIQSCVNIKTELEKLPKLSRIVMDGESIPMISLNIPYVKEEEYQKRMADYIDETVQQADIVKSDAERIKFIKSQLSWKRLFAVIVTDMNLIRLNLYKRESIKEQSRYLKYEEAVGSTGQSQGIYIQFLIAVINYISSINSRDADSTSLLKVIFLDNPFGAAKDIYIWEPIFKMLKTNNVQLIVPCRGATPAITGRFDVNYVLGQKLIDGRQQTVVVDYYSDVDSDSLDYTTITYEQGELELYGNV